MTALCVATSSLLFRVLLKVICLFFFFFFHSLLENEVQTVEMVNLQLSGS